LATSVSAEVTLELAIGSEAMARSLHPAWEILFPVLARPDGALVGKPPVAHIGSGFCVGLRRF
jgi:hypothetical protein